MLDRSEWSVEGPQKLDLGHHRIRQVRVRIVGGTVNVVGTDAPDARVEVTAVDGEPLKVSVVDGTLTVAHQDLPWQGFLRLLDSKSWQRRADVTLTVPTDVDLRIGVVDAAAVVTGLSGRTEVRGVTGDTTLVGLSGAVKAETVSGGIEAQGLTGDLTFSSVAGDLTVMDGGEAAVKADSVNGSLVLDLAGTPDRCALTLSTVSGEIAVRLPEDADVAVSAASPGGALSSAFDTLKVTEGWGNGTITGTLGDGTARLQAKSVSGAIALLRRPAGEESAGSPSLRKDV